MNSIKIGRSWTVPVGGGNSSLPPHVVQKIVEVLLSRRDPQVASIQMYEMKKKNNKKNRTKIRNGYRYRDIYIYR